jgi:hypothetical protein
MRLLALWQGHKNDDQIGYHRACEQLCSEGELEYYQCLPSLGADCQGVDNHVYQETIQQAEQIQADTIFLQFFHFKNMPDPAGMIASLRKIKTRPVIFVSAGDSFGIWSRPLPYSVKQASRFGDLTFLTGMGYVAEELRKNKGKNICLMPNGFCKIRFPRIEPCRNYTCEWDVVCVGSNYKVRNPLSYLFYHKQVRIKQIKALSKRYGKRFALFGKGWEGFPCWKGPLPYEKQAAVFSQSRVVVGGHPGGFMNYYTSDRDFIALSTGCEFVEHWVPRTDRLFRNSLHWNLYRSHAQMLNIIDKRMNVSESENQEKRLATINYLHSKHSQYHRMKEMLRIAQEYREARDRKKQYRPELDLFLPEVPWDEEKQYALKGWA